MSLENLELLNIALTYLEIFGLVLAYCGARKYNWVDSFEEYFHSLTKFEVKDYLDQWPNILLTLAIGCFAVLLTDPPLIPIIEASLIIFLLPVIAIIARYFILFSKGSFVTTLGIFLAIPSIVCRLFC